MQRPSVVVFDLGKVLLDFDYGIAGRKFAKRGKMSFEQLAHLLTQSTLLGRYETGALTTQQFYDEIRLASGFAGNLEEFAEYFSDIFFPIQPMIDLQAALRRNAVPTYVFSNTNELAVVHIRKVFPFFHNFDGHILSYEHGAMKPDAKLYEVVESKAARRAADILYFDDRPENVAAGAARGWQAVLQESPECSVALVRKLGLLNSHGATKQ
jgi:HAD superfamily hydrolase (TIGR01509 family)